MKKINKVKSLCTPAYIYLVISILSLISMMFQNKDNTDKFCLGEYECNVENTAFIFLYQGIYIILWTFILNCLCKAGYKNISWFLVLFPFLLLAVVLGLLLLSDSSQIMVLQQN
tara:strand:- start:408 stop:749 length:342 start_codon:yes stop_codon:yes gene_type:complete